MKNLSTWFSRHRIGYNGVLGLILLACFLLTSLSIKSYGVSFDEPLIHDYSNNNLRAYINVVFYKPFDELTTFYNLQYYGPALWTGAKIAALPLQRIFPALDEWDAWHIVNFATFLLGAWCLFCLGRRFATPLAALGATLLYLTQPLLWGHGVMNPKDVPFMTFFLASVLTGMRMVEEAAKPVGPGSGPFNLSRRGKFFTGLALLLVGLGLIDLVTGHFLSRAPVTALISLAESAAPGTFLHSVFVRLAAHSATVSPVYYVTKTLQIINVVEFAVLLLVSGTVLAIWLKRTSSRNRRILLAGVTAGLTISIRVLGPAAMGLVGVYAVAKLRRRSVGPLLAYLVIALLASYATWPYLWANPLGRFVESLQIMAQFPWNGTIRFENGDVLATELPWYYLPKLIAIQLTLPALGLALTGMALMIRSVLRRSLDWGLAAVPLLWFLAPLGGVLLLHLAMYDNFRQFLFILPPLFLFAAVAVDVILRQLRKVRRQNAFLLAVLLPGIITGAWLHPYEYVYYNALVGWTGQVGRQYETDYWDTSLCEAAQYLSTVAPEGASVALTDSGFKLEFLRCATKKFSVLVERAEVSRINPDFSVIPTRFDDDIDYFRWMPVINTIGRGQTEFMVIKKAP